MISETVIKVIVRELVQTGTYKDEQSALKAMAIEQASKKIAEYRRTVRRLQRKYKVQERATAHAQDQRPSEHPARR